MARRQTPSRPRSARQPGWPRAAVHRAAVVLAGQLDDRPHPEGGGQHRRHSAAATVGGSAPARQPAAAQRGDPGSAASPATDRRPVGPGPRWPRAGPRAARGPPRPGCRRRSPAGGSASCTCQVTIVPGSQTEPNGRDPAGPAPQRQAIGSSVRSSTHSPASSASPVEVAADRAARGRRPGVAAPPAGPVIPNLENSTRAVRPDPVRAESALLLVRGLHLVRLVVPGDGADHRASGPPDRAASRFPRRPVGPSVRARTHRTG